MSDILTVQDRFQGELLGIDDATERYFGDKVSPFSVRRWISKGIGRPRIKLRAIRIGGKYFLSPADCKAFIEALRDPSTFARERRSERVEVAKQRLQKAGA